MIITVTPTAGLLSSFRELIQTKCLEQCGTHGRCSRGILFPSIITYTPQLNQTASVNPYGLKNPELLPLWVHPPQPLGCVVITPALSQPLRGRPPTGVQESLTYVRPVRQGEGAAQRRTWSPPPRDQQLIPVSQDWGSLPSTALHLWPTSFSMKPSPLPSPRYPPPSSKWHLHYVQALSGHLHTRDGENMGGWATILLLLSSPGTQHTTWYIDN